jgi:hypothetical protein
MKLPPPEYKGTRHARNEGLEALQAKELVQVFTAQMRDFPQDSNKDVWNHPLAN